MRKNLLAAVEGIACSSGMVSKNSAKLRKEILHSTGSRCPSENQNTKTLIPALVKNVGVFSLVEKKIYIPRENECEKQNKHTWAECGKQYTVPNCVMALFLGKVADQTKDESRENISRDLRQS